MKKLTFLVGILHDPTFYYGEFKYNNESDKLPLCYLQSVTYIECYTMTDKKNKVFLNTKYITSIEEYDDDDTGN